MPMRHRCFYVTSIQVRSVPKHRIRSKSPQPHGLRIGSEHDLRGSGSDIYCHALLALAMVDHLYHGTLLLGIYPNEIENHAAEALIFGRHVLLSKQVLKMNKVSTGGNAGESRNERPWADTANSVAGHTDKGRLWVCAKVTCLKWCGSKKNPNHLVVYMHGNGDTHHPIYYTRGKTRGGLIYNPPLITVPCHPADSFVPTFVWNPRPNVNDGIA